MRIVTYGAAVSLDGFIAGADGSLDWLHFSTDVQELTAAYWSRVDTILMGRKTWEVGRAMAEQNEPSPEWKEAMGGITTYVFSRTLKEASVPGAHLVASDAGEFVQDLKRRPGKEICLMGGGELAQSLFTAGVIDEVGLNIHPVILGSGIPFFRDPGRRIALTLAESRTIAGGCILATYRVKTAARRSKRKAS